MPNESATAVPTEQSEAVTTTTSIFDELDEQYQSSTETGEVEETEQAEPEAEEVTDESDDPNWLPSEQLKEFAPEVIAKYAKRYGYTPEEIAADPRLSRALKDKINSDIEIADRKKADEAAEEEESEEEAEPQREPTPEEIAKSQTEREAKQLEYVHQITDKATAIKFTSRLAAADAIKDPEQRAIAVTEALTLGMVNVFPDLVNAYLGGPGGYLEQAMERYIESRLPGLGESHMQTSLASAFESIAASNPKYSAMGLKFGSPEFHAAAQKAAEIMPGMETVKFHDAQGRELPRLEQFKRKAEMLFRLLTNAPGAVAAASKAIETGKKIERDNAQRKTNAKLGAGQSKGLAAKTTGNDDLFGAPGEIAISQKLIGKQS